ncbi:hypothetical protein X777_01709, partial [Ooceraea biroi]
RGHIRWDVLASASSVPNTHDKSAKPAGLRSVVMSLARIRIAAFLLVLGLCNAETTGSGEIKVNDSIGRSVGTADTPRSDAGSSEGARGDDEDGEEDLPILPPIILLDFDNGTQSDNATDDKSKRTVNNDLGYGFDRNALHAPRKYNYYFPAGKTTVSIEESISPFLPRTIIEKVPANDQRSSSFSRPGQQENRPAPATSTHQNPANFRYHDQMKSRPVFGLRTKLTKISSPEQYGGFSPIARPTETYAEYQGEAYASTTQQPVVFSRTEEAGYATARPHGGQGYTVSGSSRYTYVTPSPQSYVEVQSQRYLGQGSQNTINVQGYSRPAQAPVESSTPNSVDPSVFLESVQSRLNPQDYARPGTNAVESSTPTPSEGVESAGAFANLPRYTVENGVRYENKIFWKYPDGRVSDVPPMTYETYSEYPSLAALQADKSSQDASQIYESGPITNSVLSQGPVQFPLAPESGNPPTPFISADSLSNLPQQQVYRLGYQNLVSQKQIVPQQSKAGSGPAPAYTASSTTSPPPRSSLRSTGKNQKNRHEPPRRPILKYMVNSPDPEYAAPYTMQNAPRSTPPVQSARGNSARKTNAGGRNLDNYSNLQYTDLLNYNPSISQYIKNPTSILNVQPTFVILLFLSWPLSRCTKDVGLNSEEIFDQLATASENIAHATRQTNESLNHPREQLSSVSSSLDATLHYENSNGFVPMIPSVSPSYDPDSSSLRPTDLGDNRSERNNATNAVSAPNNSDTRDEKKLEEDLAYSSEARIFLSFPGSLTNRRSFDFQAAGPNEFELLKVSNDTPAVANYKDFYENMRGTVNTDSTEIDESSSSGRGQRSKEIEGYGHGYGNPYAQFYTYNNAQDAKKTTYEQEKVTGNYRLQDTANYDGHGQSTTKKNAAVAAAPSSSRTNYGVNELGSTHGGTYDNVAEASKTHHRFSRPVVVAEPSNYKVDTKFSSQLRGASSDNDNYKTSRKLESSSAETNLSDESVEYVERPRVRVQKTRRRPASQSDSTRKHPKEHQVTDQSTEEQDKVHKYNSSKLKPQRYRVKANPWANDPTASNLDESVEDARHDSRGSGAGTKSAKVHHASRPKHIGTWSHISPSLEISHSSGIELDHVEKPKYVVPVKVNIVPLANFDHATALGNSQGFDVSNAMLQNFVTTAPISAFSTTAPILSTPMPDVIVGQSSFQNPVQTVLLSQPTGQIKIADTLRTNYHLPSTMTPVFALTSSLTPALQSVPVQSDVTPRTTFAVTSTPAPVVQQLPVNQLQQLIVPQPTIQTFLQAPFQTGSGYQIQVNPHGLQGQNLVNHNLQVQSLPTTPTLLSTQPESRINPESADSQGKKDAYSTSGTNFLASASLTVGQNEQKQATNTNSYYLQQPANPLEGVVNQQQLQVQLNKQLVKSNRLPNVILQAADSTASHSNSVNNAVGISSSGSAHLPKVGMKNVEIINPNIKPSPIDTTVNMFETMHYPTTFLTTPIPIFSTVTPITPHTINLQSFVDSLTESGAKSKQVGTLDLKPSQNQERPVFNPINFVPNADIIKNQNTLNNRLPTNDPVQQGLNLVPVMPGGNFFKPSHTAQNELVLKPKLASDLQKYAEEMFKESLKTMYNSQKWNNDRRQQQASSQNNSEASDLAKLRTELQKLRASLSENKYRDVLEAHQSENKVRATDAPKFTKSGSKKPEMLLATLENILKTRPSGPIHIFHGTNRPNHKHKPPGDSDFDGDFHDDFGSASHLTEYLTPPRQNSFHKSPFHDKPKKRPGSSRFKNGPRKPIRSKHSPPRSGLEASSSNIDIHLDGPRYYESPFEHDSFEYNSRHQSFLDAYPSLTTSSPEIFSKILRELKSSSKEYDINHPRMHNLLGLLMKNKQLPTRSTQNYFRDNGQLGQYFESQKRRQALQFFDDNLRDYLERADVTSQQTSGPNRKKVPYASPNHSGVGSASHAYGSVPPKRPLPYGSSSAQQIESHRKSPLASYFDTSSTPNTYRAATSADKPLDASKLIVSPSLSNLQSESYSPIYDSFHQDKSIELAGFADFEYPSYTGIGKLISQDFQHQPGATLSAVQVPVYKTSYPLSKAGDYARTYAPSFPSSGAATQPFLLRTSYQPAESDVDFTFGPASKFSLTPQSRNVSPFLSPLSSFQGQVVPIQTAGNSAQFPRYKGASIEVYPVPSSLPKAQGSYESLYSQPQLHFSKEHGSQPVNVQQNTVQSSISTEDVLDDVEIINKKNPEPHTPQPDEDDDEDERFTNPEKEYEHNSENDSAEQSGKHFKEPPTESDFRPSTSFPFKEYDEKFGKYRAQIDDEDSENKPHSRYKNYSANDDDEEDESSSEDRAEYVKSSKPSRDSYEEEDEEDEEESRKHERHEGSDNDSHKVEPKQSKYYGKDFEQEFEESYRKELPKHKYVHVKEVPEIDSYNNPKPSRRQQKDDNRSRVNHEHREESKNYGSRVSHRNRKTPRTGYRDNAAYGTDVSANKTPRLVVFSALTSMVELKEQSKKQKRGVAFFGSPDFFGIVPAFGSSSWAPTSFAASAWNPPSTPDVALAQIQVQATHNVALQALKDPSPGTPSIAYPPEVLRAIQQAKDATNNVAIAQHKVAEAKQAALIQQKVALAKEAASREAAARSQEISQHAEAEAKVSARQLVAMQQRLATLKDAVAAAQRVAAAREAAAAAAIQRNAAETAAELQKQDVDKQISQSEQEAKEKDILAAKENAVAAAVQQASLQKSIHPWG